MARAAVGARTADIPDRCPHIVYAVQLELTQSTMRDERRHARMHFDRRRAESPNRNPQEIDPVSVRASQHHTHAPPPTQHRFAQLSPRRTGTGAAAPHHTLGAPPALLCDTDALCGRCPCCCCWLPLQPAAAATCCCLLLRARRARARRARAALRRDDGSGSQTRGSGPAPPPPARDARSKRRLRNVDGGGDARPARRAVP